MSDRDNPTTDRIQIVMRALYDSHPTAMPPFSALRPDVLAIFSAQAVAVLNALKEDGTLTG